MIWSRRLRRRHTWRSLSLNQLFRVLEPIADEKMKATMLHYAARVRHKTDAKL